MTSTPDAHTNQQSAPILRWIFHRGASAITCELDARGNRSYDVCIVPHWDVLSSVVEHFEAPSVALLRHAEIARRLRASGWVLTDRGPTVCSAAA
jgi:hypothetical protein